MIQYARRLSWYSMRTSNACIIQFAHKQCMQHVHLWQGRHGRDGGRPPAAAVVGYLLAAAAHVSCVHVHRVRQSMCHVHSVHGARTCANLCANMCANVCTCIMPIACIACACAQIHAHVCGCVRMCAGQCASV